MRVAPHLTTILALAALAGFAQTAGPKPELLLYHPSGPPLSYEVATIKPIDPDTAGSMVKLPPGLFLSPLSVRRYIMNAYGAMYQAQVVGGPDWLNKDAYNIKGKVPDDLEAAKMTSAERYDQNRAMQQSLLAERFHLKAHFETRVLPVYEIIPAKGGLKITEVPAPPERKPGDQPIRFGPGDPVPPGTSITARNSAGLSVFNGRAIQVPMLARIMGGEIGDRPIVDHSGFTGYFDVKDLTWAPLGDATAANSPDAPSLSEALERQLGLKLVPARDPIEVLVIDSIDRPTEN
ncbi:MAG: TIGR03435 family protein [Acidobacteriaceae bacterium]